jgi:hypothetical protein
MDKLHYLNSVQNFLTAMEIRPARVRIKSLNFYVAIILAIWVQDIRGPKDTIEPEEVLTLEGKLYKCFG